METANYSYQLAVAANQNIKERNYWLETLSGNWIKTSFHNDFKKNENVSTKAPPQKDSLEFPLSAELASRLMALSSNSDYTLHIVMVSGLVGLLNKYNSNQDIIIGTPIYKQEIETVFINTVLVLRNRLSKNMSFKDLLLQVKQTVLGAAQNQNYPIPMLTKWLYLPTSQNENPFYDIVLLLENIQDKTYVKESDYNILFSFLRTNGNIKGHVEYNPDLYREKTIERTIDHFIRLLGTGAANVNTRLEDIDLLDEEEKKQILVDFNSTENDFPLDKTIVDLFEEKVIKIPDCTALVSKEEGKKNIGIPGTNLEGYLSYHELNKKANQLAHLLIEKGVQHDTIAGIVAERSMEIIIGMLAIFKAGGAYLPIEPGYPGKRVSYMLADSEAKVLITTSALTKDKIDRETILLDTLDFSNLSPSQLLNSSTSPSSLAYVIYTSGSTGKPKAVMVQHNNLVNAALAWQKEYCLREIQVNLLQIAGFSFDVFLGDVARVFINGGKMAICPAEIRLVPPALYSLIKKQWITLFETTPSLAIPFMDYVYENQLVIDNLQLLIVGSENFRVEDYKKLQERFGKQMRIINSYGTTETTIDSSYFEGIIERIPYSGNVFIGSPLPNMKFLIWGPGGGLQAIGVPGELSIGGPGVSRGYLNKPELTAEKFGHDLWDYHDYQDKNRKVCFEGTRGLALLLLGKNHIQSCNHASMQHHSPSHYYPITPLPHYPIYMTGDLARWLADGNIEYFGRKDQQVKIRGFRIETEEIENLLLKKTGIKEAVVIAREAKDGEKYLCAYYVNANNDQDLKQEQETGPNHRGLREYLQEKLPDYMLPSFFMELEQFPLTPGGKIDRKALPEPKVKTSVEYKAPRNDTEKQLQKIWQEIFESEHIGIDDDFFAIGGHSLKAAVMISKIHQTLNITLPLGEVFKSTTIKSLAEYINSEEVVRNRELLTPGDDQLVLLKSGIITAAAGNSTDTTPTQHNLFLIHDGTGDVEVYIEFCGLLTGQFNCWGIRPQRLQGYAPRKITIEEVARNYIEKIKGLQPQGPYHITGWSTGGTIAFEMTRQLERQQEKISFLGMIDVVVPHHQLKTGISEFTMESEAAFIHKHLPGIEMKQDPHNPEGINQIWSTAVEYLKNGHLDEKIIKKLAEAFETPLNPDDQQQNKNIGSLIKVLNMGRTLLYARSFYMPDGKINTPVHYFAASQSAEIINEQDWNNFCSIPIKIRQIPGDHYSIFKMPQLEALAKTFDKALTASR